MCMGNSKHRRGVVHVDDTSSHVNTHPLIGVGMHAEENHRHRKPWSLLLYPGSITAHFRHGPHDTVHISGEQFTQYLVDVISLWLTYQIQKEAIAQFICLLLDP